MFFPRGIALFGGISRPGSFGQLILHSQVRYGYRGRVYPISRKGGEIAGIPILGSLAEADGPVDLASVSVPAEAVPAVLDQCLAHRVGGAQIHSSGFAETGKPEGIALEARLADFIARGLRIVGPNCFGIHCPLGGITLLPGFDFSARPGPVAFVSQSGGVATDFGYEAECAGLGLSKIISFGNGCDLDAAALFDYLADDPETGYVAAYLEGVRDGRTFFDALRRTASKKPVVIWKAGLTPLGSRAACSHTGSMAGGAEAWEGVLRQTGAAPVQGLDDMMDALVALRYLENPVRRIALMGGGGAIGVFGSDLAHRWGMEIPTFSSETRKRLRRHFPTPGNSMKNPLDTGTPVLPLETVRSLAREVLTREPVDALILILLMRPLEVELPNFLRMSGMEPPPGGSYLKGLVEDLSTLKRETGKEVIMVLENRARKVEEVTVEEIYRQSRRLFQEQGIPVFPRVQRALRGLHHAAAGAARLRTARGC
jgi:acyl-CoA synthetase (NDP forming)